MNNGGNFYLELLSCLMISDRTYRMALFKSGNFSQVYIQQPLGSFVKSYIVLNFSTNPYRRTDTYN
jgi:hypothetical protein